MNFIKQAIKKWVCKSCNIAANQNISDINQFYGQGEFKELKNTILIWIKNRNRDEQIILLDYIVEMLKEDMCSGNAAKVLMSSYSSPYTDFIPLYYEDENGFKRNILCDEKQSVNLAKSHIYLCPWNKARIPDNLLRLKQTSFRYDDNHKSHYYTDIDLCHVYNGNHSIHIGVYLKKGEIKSEVCRTELLYSHCYTDGEYWYNSHTNEIISKVADFRIAALYYAAQIRHRIKSGECI